MQRSAVPRGSSAMRGPARAGREGGEWGGGSGPPPTSSRGPATLRALRPSNHNRLVTRAPPHISSLRYRVRHQQQEARQGGPHIYLVRDGRRPLDLDCDSFLSVTRPTVTPLTRKASSAIATAGARLTRKFMIKPSLLACTDGSPKCLGKLNTRQCFCTHLLPSLVQPRATIRHICTTYGTVSLFTEGALC
jgi:hypothetical protein